MSTEVDPDMSRGPDYYEAYMTRIGNESIPAYEPSLGEHELELLGDVIRRNWLSEGKYVKEFERRLGEACDRSRAIAFCNATSAIIAGLRGRGIGVGDEVIVPSFTHPADPNAIAVIGATPIFSDVDEDSLCLSVDTIDRVKTVATRAILFVSSYGNVSDLDNIVEYADHHGLTLVNDCAPALFGSYRERPIASYGDFAALSFFADKTITTGEGGMLLTDSDDLAEEAQMFKHDGRHERGHDLIERIGYNFRITELQAAVGVAQLDRAQDFIAGKLDNERRYRDRLQGLSQARVFDFNPEGEIVPHRTLIFVDDAAPLITHLTSAGIGARCTFTPMHSQPCYATGRSLPITDRLHAGGVCLPSAPGLSDEQIAYVCDAIRDYYDRG